MSMGETITREAGGKGQITKCPLYHIKNFESFPKHSDMALEKFFSGVQTDQTFAGTAKPGVRKTNREIKVK